MVHVARLALVIVLVTSACAVESVPNQSAPPAAISYNSPCSAYRGGQFGACNSWVADECATHPDSTNCRNHLNRFQGYCGGLTACPADRALACVAGSCRRCDFSGNWVGYVASLSVDGNTVNGTWASWVGRPNFSGTLSDGGCAVSMNFPDDAVYQGTMVNACQIQWSYPNSTTVDPNNMWFKDDCTP